MTTIAAAGGIGHMTARKPVRALALGLSSAVVFGFGAGPAGADVDQLVRQRHTSLQGNPVPSPVLALSAVLARADAAALLRNLDYQSQVKLALLIRRLPDLSMLQQTRLCSLARADQARAQAVIAAALSRLPNLSRYQVTTSAALLAAILAKSSNLAVLGHNSVPALSGLDSIRTRAAIHALLARLSYQDSVSQADAAWVLTALQRAYQARVSALAGLSLSDLAYGSGRQTAAAYAALQAIAGARAGMSRAKLGLTLGLLAGVDLGGILNLSIGGGLTLSSVSRLNHYQLDAVAAAIASQALRSSLSQAQLATAQYALARIDVAALPDLSRVDLYTLVALPI
jgi:outer membrane lipoprotein SlyB